MEKPASNPATTRQPPRRFGLCAKTQNLTKTECCNEWICNDEANHQRHILYSRKGSKF